MAGLISLDILSHDHPSLLSTAQTPTLLSSPPPSTHLFYLLPISPLSHAMEVRLVDRAHVPEAHCQGGLGHEQLHRLHRHGHGHHPQHLSLEVSYSGRLG